MPKENYSSINGLIEYVSGDLIKRVFKKKEKRWDKNGEEEDT